MYKEEALIFSSYRRYKKSATYRELTMNWAMTAGAAQAMTTRAATDFMVI